MYMASAWKIVGRGFTTVMYFAKSSFHITLPKNATASNMMMNTTKLIHDLGNVYPGNLLSQKPSKPSTPDPITLEIAPRNRHCIYVLNIFNF